LIPIWSEEATVYILGFLAEHAVICQLRVTFDFLILKRAVPG
jgi:hypothetical protein